MVLTTADATIIDRGRGPEIAGTRITVYDVMDYLKHGWHRDRIAALFRLSSRDIQAAIDYIDQHRERIEADYQAILERHRNAEGHDSLEVAINELGTSSSLPVVTIGDPDRLMRDRDYAERAAAQLMQYLLDLDNLRGTGRLYVP